MLDVAGRFTFLNDQLRDVFAYDRDALIGRDWNALLAPEFRPQLQHHLDERRNRCRCCADWERRHAGQRNTNYFLLAPR